MNLKRGDKVYDKLYGHGEVIDLRNNYTFIAYDTEKHGLLVAYARTEPFLGQLAMEVGDVQGGERVRT